MPSKHLPFTLFRKASRNLIHTDHCVPIGFWAYFVYVMLFQSNISISSTMSTFPFPPQSHLCLRLPQNVFLVLEIAFLEWYGQLAKANFTACIRCVLNTRKYTFSHFFLLFDKMTGKNIRVKSDTYLDFSMFPHTLHHISYWLSSSLLTLLTFCCGEIHTINGARTYSFKLLKLNIIILVL